MVEHQAKTMLIEHHLDLIVFAFWAILIISELIGFVGFFSKDYGLMVIVGILFRVLLIITVLHQIVLTLINCARDFQNDVISFSYFAKTF
jgi:hypothetical protein